MRENYYRRNIIVHNKGCISKDYIKKIDTAGPSDEGKDLIDDYEYINRGFDIMWEYIDFILGKSIAKFDLDIEEGFIYTIEP